MKKAIIISIVTILILLIGVSMLSAQKTETIVVMKTSLGDIEITLNHSIAPKTVDNFLGLATGTKEWKDPKTQEMVKRPFYDGLTFHRVISDFMIQGGCPIGNGTGGPGYSFEDETYILGEPLIGQIKSPEEAYQVYTDILVPYFRSNPTQIDNELLEIVKEAESNKSIEPFVKKDFEFYYEKTNSKPLQKKQGLSAKVEYGTICMANSGPNTNGSQFFIVTKKEGCSWLDGKHTVFGKVTKGMDIVHKIENVQKDASDKPITAVKIEKVTVK